MRILRKDYQPIPDTALDKLKADLIPLLGTFGMMTLPADKVFNLVMEIIDSREELFRLRLCETVDQIITDELSDGDMTFIGLRWPDDFTFGGEEPSSRVYRPAFPCKETTRLGEIPQPPDLSSGPKGQRMPGIDR